MNSPKKEATMYLTITTSKVTEEDLKIIKPYMDQFLPRLKKVPGVLAVYYSIRPDKGDETTFIVWESTEALQAYRKESLFKEAADFEEAHGFASTRDAYPLNFGASSLVK
jgi:heme-degrading monooxygenase HmoA